MKWETLDHHPVRLFDDSAGRVFLFDGKNVRVLGTDGKWSVEEICQNRHSEGVNFVEQGKRIWLWGSRELPGGLNGMLGVWSYEDGKWTHHDTKTGLPFDSVNWMHPLADGRFVLMQDRAANGGVWAPVFWHPDRKLMDEEKVVLRLKELVSLGGQSTGIDGTLYLGGAGDSRVAGSQLAPKGEVGFNSDKEENGNPSRRPVGSLYGQHHLREGQRAVSGAANPRRRLHRCRSRRPLLLPPRHAEKGRWGGCGRLCRVAEARKARRHRPTPEESHRRRDESCRDDVGKIWAEAEAGYLVPSSGTPGSGWTPRFNRFIIRTGRPDRRHRGNRGRWAHSTSSDCTARTAVSSSCAFAIATTSKTYRKGARSPS